MNKERRALVEKARKLLDEAKSLITEAAEGERNAFENLTDALQQTEKNQKIGQNAEDLDMMVGELDSIDTSLENIICET